MPKSKQSLLKNEKKIARKNLRLSELNPLIKAGGSKPIYLLDSKGTSPKFNVVSSEQLKQRPKNISSSSTTKNTMNKLVRRLPNKTKL